MLPVLGLAFSSGANAEGMACVAQRGGALAAGSSSFGTGACMAAASSCYLAKYGVLLASLAIFCLFIITSSNILPPSVISVPLSSLLISAEQGAYRIYAKPAARPPEIKPDSHS